MFDRAIEDYNKAIELNPELAEAYNNRGVAYCIKGDYDRAIVDYNTAIALKRDYTADAYYNRGEAWLHLGEWEKAKLDLTVAGVLGVNIVTEFCNDYESVSDFEGKHGVQLPEAISAMLTQ